MIKRFLSLGKSERARIVMWLYDRYVVRPALEELTDLGLVVELEPDFLILDEKMTYH